MEQTHLQFDTDAIKLIVIIGSTFGRRRLPADPESERHSVHCLEMNSGSEMPKPTIRPRCVPNMLRRPLSPLILANHCLNYSVSCGAALIELRDSYLITFAPLRTHIVWIAKRGIRSCRARLRTGDLNNTLNISMLFARRVVLSAAYSNHIFIHALRNIKFGVR